ncbi:hypothetical protein LTR95_011235 [Oleoguttula sp. CCFEE 5521]
MESEPIVINTSEEESGDDESEAPRELRDASDGEGSEADWPDMVHDTDELHPLHAIEIKKAALRRAAFADSSWHAGNELGAGGFGTVFVAYKLNEHFEVTKRVAVKDVYMKRSDVEKWTKWDGDPRNLEERVPIEAAIMIAIVDADGDGAEKTVYLRHACPFNRAHQTYRLYMEYCWPSLSEAIGRRIVDLQNDPNDPESAHFPEFLLWKWLEDLTEASIVLSEGSLQQLYRRTGDRSSTATSNPETSYSTSHGRKANDPTCPSCA